MGHPTLLRARALALSASRDGRWLATISAGRGSQKSPSLSLSVWSGIDQTVFLGSAPLPRWEHDVDGGRFNAWFVAWKADASMLAVGFGARATWHGNNEHAKVGSNSMGGGRLALPFPRRHSIDCKSTGK